MYNCTELTSTNYSIGQILLLVRFRPPDPALINSGPNEDFNYNSSKDTLKTLSFALGMLKNVFVVKLPDGEKTYFPDIFISFFNNCN